MKDKPRESTAEEVGEDSRRSRPADKTWSGSRSTSMMGLRKPPSPGVGGEVRAWVKEDLMPLMGKESGGSRQQPPVAIAGGSGVVDVADGSLRA